MTKTRVPTQKRSIEKRQKIVKAGFDLFCEKGYYKTNTAEIAKYAGVSTGALYSYFEDKRQIFTEAFQQHLDAISSELLQQLISLPEVLELSTFIEKWMDVYISCILIDSLRQEKTSFSHNGLDFEIIKKQVKQSIFQMLST